MSSYITKYMNLGKIKTTYILERRKYNIIETKQSTIKEKTVVDGEELLRHILIRIDFSKKKGGSEFSF